VEGQKALLLHTPRHRPSMRRRRKTELHPQARAPILAPPALIAETPRELTEEMPLLALIAEMPQVRTAGTPQQARTAVTPLRARTAAMPQQVRTVETPQARTEAEPLEQTPVEVPTLEERKHQPLGG